MVTDAPCPCPSPGGAPALPEKRSRHDTRHAHDTWRALTVDECRAHISSGRTDADAHIDAHAHQCTGLRFGENLRWTVCAVQSSIATCQVVDCWTAELGLPMPTMVFPGNELCLEFNGTNTSSPVPMPSFRLTFTCKDALRHVDTSAGPPWTVSAGEQWRAGRAGSEELATVTEVVLPFDWTYSTDYRGTLSALSLHEHALSSESSTTSSLSFASPSPSSLLPPPQWQPASSMHTINYALLRRPDPILYYQELTLFEDELADNGLASLTVKVRVMPGCVLVLQRFFLRLEGVVLRVRDTRVFYEFGAGVVVREYAEQEAPFGALSGHPEAVLDTMKLMDVNWVAAHLPPPDEQTVVREVLLLEHVNGRD